jgi:hypothetical protein
MKTKFLIIVFVLFFVSCRSTKQIESTPKKIPSDNTLYLVYSPNDSAVVYKFEYVVFNDIATTILVDSVAIKDYIVVGR